MRTFACPWMFYLKPVVVEAHMFILSLSDVSARVSVCLCTSVSCYLLCVCVCVCVCVCTCSDQLPAEADLNYLSNATKMELYGVELQDAKVSFITM